MDLFLKCANCRGGCWKNSSNDIRIWKNYSHFSEKRFIQDDEKSKQRFCITLVSCLSCPNLATTFSRQNWQGAAVKEKFGSRCCLQYTVQHSLFLPSSHFLLFWSKAKPSWKLSRLDWFSWYLYYCFHFSQLYFLLRSNYGLDLLVNFQKSTNTFFSPQAFWEIKVLI